jgi:hypothetical protein
MNTQVESYTKTFKHILDNERDKRYPSEVHYIVPDELVHGWNRCYEIDDRFLLASEQVNKLFLECISYDSDFLKVYLEELEAKKKTISEDDREVRDSFTLKINLVNKILEIRKLNVMKKEEKEEEPNSDDDTAAEELERADKFRSAAQMAYLESALKFFRGLERKAKNKSKGE